MEFTGLFNKTAPPSVAGLRVQRSDPPDVHRVRFQDRISGKVLPHFSRSMRGPGVNFRSQPMDPRTRGPGGLWMKRAIDRRMGY